MAETNPNPKKRARRNATTSPPEDISSSSSTSDALVSSSCAADAAFNPPIIISGVEGPKKFLINGIYDPHPTIKTLYSCRADLNRWIEYNGSKAVWMVLPTTYRGTTRCWAYFSPTLPSLPVSSSSSNSSVAKPPQAPRVIPSPPPPGPPSNSGVWYVVSPDAKSYIAQVSIVVATVRDLYVVSLCRDSENESLVGVYDDWDRAMSNARNTFATYWSEHDPAAEWMKAQYGDDNIPDEQEFETERPFIVDNSESAELSRAGGVVFTVGGDFAESVSVTVKRMELNMDVATKKSEKSEAFKALY